MACETGISPLDLIDSPPEVFDAVLQYLRDRAAEQRKRRR